MAKNKLVHGLVFLTIILTCTVIGVVASPEDDPIEGVYAVSSRSSKWTTFRDTWIKSHPHCAVCGTTTGIELHHIKSVSEHPELELDPDNVVSLCGDKANNCHFKHGHDPDGVDGPLKPNWRAVNPNIRQYIEQHGYRP
jgi:5-methylcytosine-specific restriction endonuclease McrA